MIAIALAVSCALVQDEAAGAFDWARALEDLGLSAAWGDFSAELSGELELDLLVFGEEAPGTTLEDPVLRSDVYNRTRQEEGRQGLGRFSLFLDGGFQNWLTYEVEGRVDKGEPAEAGEAVGARLEQYWVRGSIPDSTLLNLELGKFSAPVGNFIPRSSARKNPLATFPLIYDQVTTFMKKSDLPANVLGRRDLPAVKDWRVPIYRELYGVGGMVFGTWKDLTVSMAVMNSAPGSWVFQWPLHAGDFRDPNYYLHLSYALDPSLTLGSSLSRGPYDRHDAAGIPTGRDTGDFPQTLAGVDLQYAIAAVEIFAEAYWTRFKAPLIGDLDLWSWYVEAKYTFLPGLFGALRVAQMMFGQIDDAAGVPAQWDRNLARVEFGGGYFFTRNFFTKATMQLNHTMGGREPHDNLFLWQVGLTF